MSLKLMYITNSPDVAKIAEAAGVDRIFVDMEYIGKANRQGGMDTVQSHHTVQDIENIKRAVNKADVMVRVNPIHEATEEYCSSKDEIDAAIKAGADIIMLPYFKTDDEVKTFVELVDGRAKTLPLVETPEAVEVIDEILTIDGIDEIYVGLNDLSLGYGKKFMFELLSDGTVEKLCLKFKLAGIPYGFGGIPAVCAPIIIPLGAAAGSNLLIVIAAIVCGGTFCSHACFYSDATVITSNTCGIENMDHVNTQLPYAILSAVLACVAFLIAGFIF